MRRCKILAYLKIIWVLMFAAGCGRAGFYSAISGDFAEKADAAIWDGPPALDVNPVDVNPVDVNPVDVNPVDVNPVDVNPVDVNPVDVNPVDSSQVDPISIEISAPAAGSYINAANHLRFALSGTCDPFGSEISVLCEACAPVAQTSCPASGIFAIDLQFGDGDGQDIQVFATQADALAVLHVATRTFVLDSVVSAATNLNWADEPAHSPTELIAAWTVSQDPRLDFEQLELHTDSANCSDPVPSLVPLISGTVTHVWTGEKGHFYNFLVVSHDLTGNLARSACSPQIEVPEFNSTTLGPDYWPELQARLQAAAAQGSSAEPSVRTIPNTVNTGIANNSYQGLVLAPNGMLYGIPRDALQIAELNPLAQPDVFATGIGPNLFGDDKYYGGALGFDESIYAAPSDYRFVLRFDPSDIAAGVEITDVDLGHYQTEENKWASLINAPNGLLIACPRDDAQVLVIDPKDPSPNGIRRVGPAFSDDNSWWGGALAPNGKIYCVPFMGEHILEIDPNDLTATGIKQVGPVFDGSWKWRFAALAPNGKLYSTPSADHYVLEIDPDDIDNSQRVGPDLGVNLHKYGAASLAANGKLYAPPIASHYVLEIDPEDTDSGIRVVGTDLGNADNKYFISNLAPNGKIYALPFGGADEILEIDPHANASFDMDVLLNGYLNGQ